MITIDFLSNILKKQTAQSDFLPRISQHVTPEIVHFEDGYFGFTIKCRGVPFESEGDRHIMNNFLALQNTFTSIGKLHGNKAALWLTVEKRAREFERDYYFSNPFCKEFSEKYLERFRKGKFYDINFYVSVILKYDNFSDGLKSTERLLRTVTNDLFIYDPEVLGVYKNQNGVLFSDFYSFVGSLVNYEKKDIPLSASNAYEYIGDADLHFGTDIVEIRSANKTKYATCWDLKSYGTSRVKNLTGILDLPFEFTFTQSFILIENTKIIEDIDKQLNNLKSVEDQAKHQHEELTTGKGLVTGQDIMFGDYHAALVVYSDIPEEAVSFGDFAESRFRNISEFAFVKAGTSAPLTFFSQVLGAKKRPRTEPKTTENLATSFGMHTYSQGKAFGNPLADGSAVIPFQTVSGGLYDFNYHFSNPETDNIGEKLAGHTLILGATSTGKTALETTTLAFCDRFNPYMFALDLDQGLKIFIKAIGGDYFALEAGEPTGLAPFQLPDSPHTRDFLNQLMGICGRDDKNGLTAAEERQIQVAVDTVMTNIAYENRNFSTFLESIPFSEEPNSLRERLQKWCRSENGRFAWVFDNVKSGFDPQFFTKVGFDLTDLLKENYAPTEPVLLFMFHLRELMLDRIALEDKTMVTVVEEFWWALRFKATEEMMLKILKTDRKLGGWLVLTSQSPEDAISSDIFPAIIQQTPTKIFLPNPDAEYEGSYDRCGLTVKEFEELSKLALHSRQFLIKQSRQSAFAKLDLGGFDELSVLSGSSSNIEILDEILLENPDAPVDVWFPLFKERVYSK